MSQINQLHYTLGKKEHLALAKKYFSQVLLTQDDNVRALWGLKYTCQSLSQLNEDEAESATTKKLLELAQDKLTKAYEHSKTKEYLA